MANLTKLSETGQKTERAPGWRSMVVLYLLSLLIYGGMAIFQAAPGYMDADYYYAGGFQIAKGDGLWEPFLWNYLDDPQGLPHPANAYWMPLASWVAAFGMVLTGSQAFSSAQIGMVLLAAGIPPLTMLLARKITNRSKDALLAGGLALFSGFYFPYLTTTDTFGIYMLLGTLFLLLMGPGGASFSQRFYPIARPLGLGVLAGLMHLSRADGLIWLATGILVGMFMILKWRPDRVKRSPVSALIVWLLVCLAGYLVVMGPWMIRNLAVFGTLLGPGGARALWITRYDELYIYPASLLTFQRWLQMGPGPIVAAIWRAMLDNIQTVFAVQGQIFLGPLVLLGAWNLRRDLRVSTGLVAWLLTVAAMTFVFPYQGARGGLFHSGSAVQPLFWALAPVGLRIVVAWVGRIWGWNLPQALRVFQFGLIGLAVLLTGLLVSGKVVGTDLQDIAWNRGLESYTRLEFELQNWGAGSGDIVMVNNAPGFFIATGRWAISVPDGPVSTALKVAQRYHACYLLLESNHPVGMDALYSQPGNLHGLIYLGKVEKTRFFRFESCAG